MNRDIFGWDLPPGCSLSDIPGNRPEDEIQETIEEGFWGKKGRSEEKELALDNAPQVYIDLIDEAIEYGIEVGNKQAVEAEKENKYYNSWYREPFKDRIRFFFKRQQERIRELETKKDD